MWVNAARAAMTDSALEFSDAIAPRRLAGGHRVQERDMSHQASGPAPETGTTPFTDTGELIDYILERYHETHRRELAELVPLARKVETVHRDHPRAPHGLAEALEILRQTLSEHMEKEERMLFPMMRQAHTAALEGPVAMMRHEHHEHDTHLRRLEELTARFTAPQDACRSWRALYAGTSKLADDLRAHMNLENKELFPRFESSPVRT